MRTGQSQYKPVRWVAPALLSGWVNFDTANYNPAGFLKAEDGFVHLRGLIKDGTPPSDLFILPTDFRPVKIIHLSTVANGAFAYVRVNPDGTVDCPTGSGTWLSLDGLAFDTRR